jgi:hypothetical protein
VKKIALVRATRNDVAYGVYGDDGTDTFRSLEGLDFVEVSDEKYREYVEAVNFYNLKKRQDHVLLLLVEKVTPDDEVKMFFELLAFRQKEEKRIRDEAAARKAATAAKAARRKDSRLKKLAAELGVEVETLKTLQQAEAR